MADFCLPFSLGASELLTSASQGPLWGLEGQWNNNKQKLQDGKVPTTRVNFLSQNLGSAFLSAV